MSFLGACLFWWENIDGLLDGRQLRKLFAQFNAQYFDGRLPNYSIRAVPYMTRRGESGRCLKRRKLIEVSKYLGDDEAISTLLHEMAHAAAPGYHGMPWKREMVRLREAGAPFHGCDLNVSLDDWGGEYVSRKRFCSAMQDLLLEAPDMITLSQAIRWFISNEGGPATTRSAFLKKYPWAREVFNQANKEHAANEELDRAVRARFDAAALTKDENLRT